MVWRQQFGERNGVYGGWISKPTIDVTTAQPGDFLLDTSSNVYQRVGTGLTRMAVNPGVGSYSQNVTLDALFAPYSKLMMWAVLYRLQGGVVSFNDNYEASVDLIFGVNAGVVNMTMTNNIALVGVEFWASWIVFRAFIT